MKMPFTFKILAKHFFFFADVQMKRTQEWNLINSQIKSWKTWDWNSHLWSNVYMTPLGVYKRKDTFLFLPCKKTLL